MDSLSFSNSLSKGSVYESESFFKAYRDDAASRLAGDAGPVAISNERIQRGDVILDTYRVEGDAILGGMGSVWRVHHQSWDTDLAMKRPQPRFFAEGSERRKEEFIAECEHWINLGLHPNIVSCYYVREIGGVPTIFSEWMDGGSLKDAIQSGRLYAGAEQEVQARILDIAIQTARGLQYSHEQGLIHQDVKPGNILLTKDWDAKVADFGLARAQSQLTDGKKSLSGGYTPAYCPKEQSDGAPAEKWMDVYAWALTVAEMYVGGHPWLSGAAASDGLEGYRAAARVAPPETVWALIEGALKDRASGFGAIIGALRTCFMETTGLLYREEEPAALLSGANLNNHAMSFLDLGKQDQAAELLQRALEVQPDNADAFLNQVFFRWKRGALTYDQAMQSIENMLESEARNRAVESLVREETGLEEVLAYDCQNPLDACRDQDGYLWILSEGELLRYDMMESKRIQAVSAEYRYGYQAVCPSGDGRYLYAAIGSGFYSGLCYRLVRIDTRDGCRVEALRADWRGGDAFEAFRGEHIKAVPYGSNCVGIWMEEDGMLCVLEESVWRDQSDDTFKTTTFLRYRLDAPLSCSLPDGPRLVPADGPERLRMTERWKKGARRDGWDHVHCHNRVVADLGEYVLLNGQVKMREREPVQRRNAVSMARDSVERDYAAMLCRKVADARHHYRISRFVSSARVAELNREREQIEEGFRKALGDRAYQDAIRQFERYRELPELRDSEQAIRMERALSAACSRVRVHHTIEVQGADFEPAEPAFVEVYGRERGRLTSQTPKKRYPAALMDIYAPLHRAFRKLPYRFELDGKTVQIGTKETWTEPVLINADHSVCYLWCDRQGALRVDLRSGEIEPVAVVDSAFPHCALYRVSADERYFAVRLDEGWMVFSRERMRGAGLATGECYEMAFSPDGRFALWHAYSDRRLYITEMANDMRRVPAAINGSSSSESFSADGSLVAILDRDGMPEKLCRLSYDYVPLDQDGGTDRAEAARVRAEHPPRKGLFARLFGGK